MRQLRDTSRRRSVGESGQALVEFALVLPLLLLVLLAIMDFSRAMNYYNTLTQLAAEGARSAFVNQNPNGGTLGATTIQQQVRDQAVATEMKNSSTFKVCIDNVPANAGDPVTVHTEYTFQFLPFLHMFNFNLRGSTTMRSEIHPGYSAQCVNS